MWQTRDSHVVRHNMSECLSVSVSEGFLGQNVCRVRNMFIMSEHTSGIVRRSFQMDTYLVFFPPAEFGPNKHVSDAT